MSAPPDLDEARRFLELLDPGAKAFTFQTFDDSKDKRPDLVRVFNAPLDAAAQKLVRLNDAGAGIFVTIGRTDLKGRKEANVTGVRAHFADLDGAPLEPVLQCELAPQIVVESSEGRFHAYWLSAAGGDDVARETFGRLQKGIIARFGSDPAVHDLPRVMRLPGFWHRKGAPFRIRIMNADAAAQRFTLDEIVEAFPPPPAPEPYPAEPGKAKAAPRVAESRSDPYVAPSRDGSFRSTRPERYMLAALAAIVTATPGERHHTIVRVSARLLGLAKAGELDARDVAARIKGAVRLSSFDRDLGEGELTLRWAWDHSDPWTLP